MNVDNLYSVRLTTQMLQNKQVFDCVKMIQQYGFGDLAESSNEKPVLMPPILNLQHSVERYKQHNVSLGEDALSYLHEVILYVTGACGLNCLFCKSEYKQHRCCTQNDNYLPWDHLKSLFSSLKMVHPRIIITGGNIFLYPNFKDLSAFFKSTGIPCTIAIHWTNLFNGIHYLNELDFGLFQIQIFVNGPYEIDQLCSLSKLMIQYKITICWEISVTSLIEYEKALCLSKHLHTDNIVIKPLYTGLNRKFFEEHVFMDLEDLDTIHLQRQEIFALQTMNLNDFGKLIIKSDGYVYTNVNKEPIGKIGESIKEIVVNALKDDSSWRQTRHNVIPCKKCRFSLICPSLSDYEYVLGKANLCHIVNDEKNEY